MILFHKFPINFDTKTKKELYKTKTENIGDRNIPSAAATIIPDNTF